MNRTLLLVIQILALSGVYGQLQTESAFPGNQQEMVDIYRNSPVYGQAIINGREYNRYSIYISRGSAYFMSDTLSSGSVLFDGRQYDNIYLLYDLVADELVTYNINNTKLVSIVKQKVTQFSVHHSAFIFLDSPARKMPGGYYQLIHEGKTTVLKKEVRKIDNDIRMGMDVQKVIKSSIDYYLLKDGKYYPVNNVSSLIEAVGDKNQQLKQFAKKNKRRFKNMNMDAVLVETAAYYDQLIK